MCARDPERWRDETKAPELQRCRLVCVQKALPWCVPVEADWAVLQLPDRRPDLIGKHHWLARPFWLRGSCWFGTDTGELSPCFHLASIGHYHALLKRPRGPLWGPGDGEPALRRQLF
jgi:hypothetical protein